MLVEAHFGKLLNRQFNILSMKHICQESDMFSEAEHGIRGAMIVEERGYGQEGSVACQCCSYPSFSLHCSSYSLLIHHWS